jgi:hypothetical protein
MNEQQRAVVQQGLEALEVVWREHKAIDGLRQLLEQQEPEQEPVAWIFKPNRELLWPDEVERKNPIELDEYAPLYTTPPAQPANWVGLTPTERKEIERHSVYVESAIRMTEAKLKEKNT